MTDPLIVVPVLGRPHRAQPLADSVHATSAARIVFVATEGDGQQIRACERTGCDVIVLPGERQPGDYARKINHAVHVTSEPWVFQGADDLDFQEGWWEACMRAHDATGAEVIGTIDQCNPRTANGRHSTHSLVARSFIDRVGCTDRQGVMLHEGYHHNFCDDELVQTARAHRVYAWAKDAVVTHRHPYDKVTPMDDTYRIALDPRSFRHDRQLLNRRRTLWTAGAARARGRPDRRRRR